jgi:hypothetical protein
MGHSTQHGLAIVSLLLERVSTIFLAVLLFRLHSTMAKADSLDFMKSWVHSESYLTIIAIVCLSIAFGLSIVEEIISWREDNEQQNKI